MLTIIELGYYLLLINSKYQHKKLLNNQELFVHLAIKALDNTFELVVCLKSEAQERLYMKKKFDSVKFQQEVRRELSEKYNSNREAFIKELMTKYDYLKSKKKEKLPIPKNKAKIAANR
ncbi:MAG: hypothetical protein AAB116_13860 [Candidatus Poribacteria bacterium]